MEDFSSFFERELKDRQNKTFKTKKQLSNLILGEIQQYNEENCPGTSIQNSNDTVDDITKRNMLESRDIPLEMIRYFFDFRMASLINCKKLLASITKNFDRKSGTLKVFPIKNKDGVIEYALLDGTHRYICYKYLYKLNVPADILKDSMEEWEWFYIAGGGNVISSTHAPMDIYSKIKLIGEVMEKKLNGKDLKANDAKPIIQKNVPGFQDKCSKEIINAYNRMYKSYKGKYLDLIQQVVMKKEAKHHSMVKDNLELPSLMSLEDSKFKEEVFHKMGESKMSKNDIIALINRYKVTKCVKNYLEDENGTKMQEIVDKIESGKYDKWLVSEDSSIRDGQIQDTKLWRKLQKLLSQNGTTSKEDREDNDNLSKDHLQSEQKRKRKSDITWESSTAKIRKTNVMAQASGDEHFEEKNNVSHLSPLSSTIDRTIEGPLRFKLPCELNIPSDKERQFMMVNGEVYLSLTFLEYERYKLLKAICRAKMLNNSVDTMGSSSIQIDDEVFAVVDDTDNNGPQYNAFESATTNNNDRIDTANNNSNNNTRKSNSSVQSIGSYFFDSGGGNIRNDAASSDYHGDNLDKKEKKKNDKRKKDKRDKKKKRDMKKQDKENKNRKNKEKNSEHERDDDDHVREDNQNKTEGKKRVAEEDQDENETRGIEQDNNVESYEEHDFDNYDDEDNGTNSLQKPEDVESENINNRNNNIDGDEGNDDETNHLTLVNQVKSYYEKIRRVFNGRDSPPRLKQWKAGKRDFSRHSGGFSSSKLKTIFSLLKEWSKHFNQVNPKFENDEELKQFVVDILWYELAYRLLSDHHGETLTEAKERLENSTKIVIDELW